MTKAGRFFPYLIICLSTLVVYLSSFSGEFILDDNPFIKNNTYIREWHSIGSILSQEDGYSYGVEHTGYYRPLVNLSYILDYKIWGLIAPGFKVTNLILHMVTCFVLFIFYKQVFNKRDTALWLALIFSLHPVATETVSWIAARNNILVTLFGILSFYFYIRAYKLHRFLFYSLSILFFTLAVFSKEFGLMLLPIFFLFQRTLSHEKGNIYTEIREYIPYIIIALLYFLLRNSVVGSLLSPKGLPDIFLKIYFLPYILLFNLRLIFFPYNLHSYFVRMPDSIFDVGPLVAIVFIMAGTYLLWRFRKNRVLLFSALAFLFAIFPAVGVIPTSAPSLIAMRWLYFPAAFIVIILFQPLEKLIRSNVWIACSVIGSVVLFLGINSYILNRFLWPSQEMFFKQEVLHFDNMYCADGLAQIYFSKKDYVSAEKYYDKSFENGIERAGNYLNYADILIRKGELEKAFSSFGKAEACSTTKEEFGWVFNNRAVAFLKSKDYDRALKEFNKSIKFLPEESTCWENMAATYGEMGDHAKAVEYFKKAIRFQSKSENIYNNLALAYILNNECQKAVILLDRKGYRENGKTKKLLERAKSCFENKN
jgi:protein O-mannosyl-transferase